MWLSQRQQHNQPQCYKNLKRKSLTQLSNAYPLPSAVSSFIAFNSNSEHASMCSSTRYFYDICMCISRHRLQLYLYYIRLVWSEKRYLFVNDLITIIHTFRFYIVHTIIQWKIGKDETNGTRMTTDGWVCASVLSVLYAEAVHKLFGSFFPHLIFVSVFCARAHL